MGDKTGQAIYSYKVKISAGRIRRGDFWVSIFGRAVVAFSLGIWMDENSWMKNEQFSLDTEFKVPTEHKRRAVWTVSSIALAIQRRTRQAKNFKKLKIKKSH